MGLSKFFQTLLHGSPKPPIPLAKEPFAALPKGVVSTHHIHPHHEALMAHTRRVDTFDKPKSKPRVSADEDTDTPTLLTTIAAMEVADSFSHDYEPSISVPDAAPAFSGFSGGESGGAGASGSFDSPSSSYDSGSSSSYDSGSSYSDSSSSSFDSGSSDSSSF